MRLELTTLSLEGRLDGNSGGCAKTHPVVFVEVRPMGGSRGEAPGTTFLDPRGLRMDNFYPTLPALGTVHDLAAALCLGGGA